MKSEDLEEFLSLTRTRGTVLVDSLTLEDHILMIKKELREKLLMEIKIKKLNEKAVIPQYATPGSAAFDFSSTENTRLLPGDTKVIGTGLSMEIPLGYELQIRPRSGMSAKTKLRVANSPGTIDSDFRGEIKIILENIGRTIELVEQGQRIAQGLITPVNRVYFQEVDELDTTERGDGGLGSTGV